MYRNLILFVAVAMLLGTGGGVCEGQVVQVSPGYVRAPFVRVFRNPDGSTSVRAPFVDVNTGPRFRVPYRMRGRRQLGPNDLANLDWQSLRRVVREAAADLEARLSRFPTGLVWQTQFGVRRIAQLGTVDENGPPTADELETIAQLVPAYDSAAKDPALRAVTRLGSFQLLHAALHEMQQPPVDRARRQLITSAAHLHLALERLSTGSTWQEYLALPGAAARSDNKSSNERVNVQSPDVEPWLKALDRFDSVSKNPEYRAIANLPEFRLTHQLLADYATLLTESAPPAPIPSMEELPSPREQLPPPRSDGK